MITREWKSENDNKRMEIRGIASQTWQLLSPAAAIEFFLPLPAAERNSKVSTEMCPLTLRPASVVDDQNRLIAMLASEGNVRKERKTVPIISKSSLELVTCSLQMGQPAITGPAQKSSSTPVRSTHTKMPNVAVQTRECPRSHVQRL
jgi:hypothetical protein